MADKAGYVGQLAVHPLLMLNASLFNEERQPILSLFVNSLTGAGHKYM